MHPAKSVIFFTTTSGAGYGLLVWLAMFAAVGLLPAARGFGLVAFGLAFGLVTAGLLASTLHLGRPERAWRAMSQWRSSWLSREGVLAIVCYMPMGLFALIWIIGGENRGFAAVLGLLGAACCLATVYATSMIYASLRAVPAWHNNWTKAVYLVVSLMTGALLLAALMHGAGYATATAADWAALVFLVLGTYVKRAYWRHVDRKPATSTVGTATGLARLGEVRMVEPPHTEDNYLLREMGFRIARKHAEKLRRIAMVTGFALPMVLIAMALPLEGAAETIFVVLAVASAAVGVAVERWLFFAQAKHVVTLYYGTEAA